MSSAPIRQPRGPPSTVAGAGQQGPPQADAEALLRRNKTVATSKHQERFQPSTGVARTGSLSGPHGRSYGFSSMSPGPSPSLSSSLSSSSGMPSNVGSGMGSSMPPAIGSIGSGMGSGGMGMGMMGNATGMNMGMDGLVRRGSERYRAAAAPSQEETLVEADEGQPDRGGTWGKSGGLTRQSSLPSRRCESLSLFCPLRCRVDADSVG